LEVTEWLSGPQQIQVDRLQTGLGPRRSEPVSDGVYETVDAELRGDAELLSDLPDGGDFWCFTRFKLSFCDLPCASASANNLAQGHLDAAARGVA